ncbi:hypothetical protein BC826DRAFT_1062233 [Russula brevipes]|nr:hypothetical protein BC826DRAFT_1062233 [Russula brevipes]
MTYDDRIVTSYSSRSTSSVQAPKGSNAGGGFQWSRGSKRVEVMTIGALPDDVLLEIFKFHLAADFAGWHSLVHVCRRWRCVVLDSARFLSLRLLCTEMTRMRETPHVWPAFPIVVSSHKVADDVLANGVDNVVAALERRERVREIDITSPLLRRTVPGSASLRLGSNAANVVFLPGSFLGGSAPRLQHLALYSILFPALRRLLLSATDLVYLRLWDIPDYEIYSPEEMVACLSPLTRLETLHLGFRCPRSLPNRQPPPLARTVLPVLTLLWFHGTSEYFEDFVARIDAPLIEDARIIFFYQPTFDLFHLPQFIGCTEQFNVIRRADVVFFGYSVEVVLSPQAARVDHPRLALGISCGQSDRLLPSLVQILSSFVPTLPTLERLDIRGYLYWPPPDSPDDIENAQWMDLLRQFTGVKSLYLSEQLVPHVAPALQDFPGERVIEMLPDLQNLFVEGPKPSGSVQEAIGRFVATRQLFYQNVTVRCWKRRRRVVNDSS